MEHLNNKYQSLAIDLQCMVCLFQAVEGSKGIHALIHAPHQHHL
jgi:hypothetical protein